MANLQQSYSQPVMLDSNCAARPTSQKNGRKERWRPGARITYLRDTGGDGLCRSVTS
jgi:hypothetical protein